MTRRVVASVCIISTASLVPRPALTATVTAADNSSLSSLRASVTWIRVGGQDKDTATARTRVWAQRMKGLGDQRNGFRHAQEEPHEEDRQEHVPTTSVYACTCVYACVHMSACMYVHTCMHVPKERPTNGCAMNMHLLASNRPELAMLRKQRKPPG